MGTFIIIGIIIVLRFVLPSIQKRARESEEIARKNQERLVAMKSNSQNPNPYQESGSSNYQATQRKRVEDKKQGTQQAGKTNTSFGDTYQRLSSVLKETSSSYSNQPKRNQNMQVARQAKTVQTQNTESKVNTTAASGVSSASDKRTQTAKDRNIANKRRHDARVSSRKSSALIKDSRLETELNQVRANKKTTSRKKLALSEDSENTVFPTLNGENNGQEFLKAFILAEVLGKPKAKQR